MRDESRITDYEFGCAPAVICFILHPSTFIPHVSRLVRESNPRQRLDRAPCFRYTNEAVGTTYNQLKGRARESNPGHDIHSVGCCHYTKLAVDTRVTAEEEGLEPSPPVGGRA